MGSVPATVPLADAADELEDEGGNETDLGDCGDADAMCEDGDSEAAPSLPPKRRKLNRLSSPQRASLSLSTIRGDGRLRAPETYSNGIARSPGEVASWRGTAHAPRGEKDGCGCMPLLKSLAPQFDVAKRTAREVKTADAAAAGRSKDVQSVYNYARLGVVVIDLLFDCRGNWVVHEACARQYLKVSNWWLARCHSRSIEAAQTPTVCMTKSAIASSSNPDSLISRIRRPDDCLMSAVQYYKSCALNKVFQVTSSVDHGLTGSSSNRTKAAEKRLFVAFVEAHRSPTGRTPDKHGRYHGAAFYLDSKWVVLRAARSSVSDTRPCFSADFNAALVAAGMQKVHCDVPLRWLRALFGSTKRVDGCYVPSDQHTTLYPHKTDACSTCVLFRSDLRTANQTLKRHKQQDDQGSSQRQEVMSQVRLTTSQLEDALRRHKSEASCAITYHKDAVTGVEQRYDDLAKRFATVMRSVPVDEQPSDMDRSAQEDLIRHASEEWFETSSDYQQDKSVPSWNKSPQPGPTYFISGETHYVHMFCAESCGEAAGPSRFSRNLVYTRSERIGGSKSSDDTLSTLCDMLLGGVRIACSNPPRYRTGFGPNGEVASGTG